MVSVVSEKGDEIIFRIWVTQYHIEIEESITGSNWKIDGGGLPLVGNWMVYQCKGNTLVERCARDLKNMRDILTIQIMELGRHDTLS